MADYPREVYLDAETEERLISFIESELTLHYGERSNHLNDLKRWQKDYWAEPMTKEATFPFKGAAVIIIPLTAIAVEAVHARTMTMAFGLPHFVSAKATSAEWHNSDRKVERFLDHELLYNIKIRRPLGDCFLEATKFGSMIGKVGYEKHTRWSVREINGVEEVFPVITKDGAVVDSVPEARFLMPYSALDPQTAQWCGEEHSMTPYEVRMLEESGMFRPGTIISQSSDPEVDDSRLAAWIANGLHATPSSGREFEETQTDLEHTTPNWPERLEWVELWLAFDVDNTPQQQKEIVVHYHRESRTFMSVRYNWNSDLSRPYRTGVYFPIEHRWRGIGICKKNEQFQREITTQHRQRLDNATLANMRMIVIHKLSGYGPREPVFPGKMWFVDDMTHVNTLQMGEIYNSAYSNEQATLLFAQQRSGVNEVTLGMPQVGTPGTATSDLARIQEGNKKYDFIYANFRDFSEQLVVDVAAVVQQFGPRQLRYYEEVEGGRLVEQFFQMPQESIRNGLLIQLKMAGQQQNKVLDRQNWQQIGAHLQAYYTGLIQLAMPMGDPQIMQLIFTKGLTAATEAMRQVLESFDVRNIERLIVQELEEIFQNGSQPAGPQQGGTGGFEGFSPESMLGGIDQAFASVAGNGEGGFNRLLNPGGGV